MSSELMRRAADILEKTAAHLDAEENRHQQAAKQERLQAARALSEKYASATGEELPPGTVERLAASDADLIAIFTKVAGRQNGTSAEDPNDMGTPSDRRDGSGGAQSGSGTTRYRDGQEKRAAAEDADQRLIDWCMS